MALFQAGDVELEVWLGEDGGLRVEGLDLESEKAALRLTGRAPGPEMALIDAIEYDLKHGVSWERLIELSEEGPWWPAAKSRSARERSRLSVSSRVLSYREARPASWHDTLEEIGSAMVAEAVAREHPALGPHAAWGVARFKGAAPSTLHGMLEAEWCLEDLLMNGNLPAHLILTRLDQYPASCALNPTLPEAGQMELTKYSGVNVRITLASNPGLTSEVAAVLAKDSDGYVRRALGRNPATPTAVLKELLADRFQEIREEVEQALNMGTGAGREL